ncbi:kelch-like protein 33 isoform X1 [Pseudochaenichthys georgianus]|uniref:kelch-like protein 33 isoform X1 n=1 Tax=Pseudochaenichthys georgianus TaxID=52239 RepID=UPI00146F53A0|nr:kelch-like protein 33 isoform X1 [Pseudochaenichthys georgianus]
MAVVATLCLVGKDLTEAEEIEEEQKEEYREAKDAEEKGRYEVDDEVDDEVDAEEDRQLRKGVLVEEKNDGEEEQQEQSREHVRIIEGDNVEQNQEGSSRGHKTVNEENECCNFDRKKKEEKGKKLTAEEETRFQVDQEKLQKDKAGSTVDEDAEHANYEDVVKIYCNGDHPTNLFRTLTEFRDSSLLTDLILSTEDGKTFNIHSPVLAAVCSYIRERLIQRNVHRVDESKEPSVGVQRCMSMSLGPEVDHVGLKAVVEFAYTGRISCLNMNTLHQIKMAAQSLGAPRVLDLCKEVEEKSTKTEGQKKEVKMSAAEEMKISLQSIERLCMERVGCDVILEAPGGSFHVHRVILAVCTDFFRGMFTSGMIETFKPCVTLPFLLASELEVLIDCSYSGTLPLSWTCVFEITCTALQLQYQPALSLCLNFLRQEINPHSCLDVASFAEAYEMPQLLEVADDFVLLNFQKVACVSKLNDLSAKKLLKYLKSPSLCVSSELAVFKAVVAWIEANPKTRLPFAKRLMKNINFPLMTVEEFKEFKYLTMWSDHNLSGLYESILDDFRSKESHCRIYQPKETLVLIGGDQISEDLKGRSISRELWGLNALRIYTGRKKAMDWKKLAEMPERERFSHEVAVLKGQLYVLGGKHYYGIHDNLNSVLRYDPLQNSWESLTEMQKDRGSFSVVVLDGMIYAIGGHCDPEYMESVERYCPTENSWSFTWPLDLPLAGHVAKAFQGKIFISGGLSSISQHLSSMFLYHPETGSTYLANMAKPRARHCMEILGERLYVAGGITSEDNMGMVDLLTCEVYNPVADSWTAFTSLSVPHVSAGGAVLGGKFYVLGGYSHEDFSETKLVHCYDPTTKRWENVGKMPGPNSDIRASVLCLPPHFRM